MGAHRLFQAGAARATPRGRVWGQSVNPRTVASGVVSLEHASLCQRRVPKQGFESKWFIPGSLGVAGGRSEARTEVLFWANAAGAHSGLCRQSLGTVPQGAGVLLPTLSPHNFRFPARGLSVLLQHGSRRQGAAEPGSRRKLLWAICGRGQGEGWALLLPPAAGSRVHPR